MNNYYNVITFRPSKDPYYDQDAEEKDLRKDKEAKQTKERAQYVKRVIVHPAFHNISFAEAEKLMDKMAQGEVIVRPSSKVLMLLSDIKLYLILVPSNPAVTIILISI